MAKRHYPPAYYRYRQKHPSISITLTDEIKEILDNLKGEQSYADFLKKLISEKTDILRLQNQLRYEKGVQKFQVPCPICKKPVFFSSKDKEWSAKIYPKLTEAFKGWQHSDCKR